MISIRYVKKFCRDDINTIENYDKAINDNTQTWDCHHRDEVKILPSGIKVIRSKQDLIENGRYYNCPANELIFLTPSEHRRLHQSGKPKSDEHRKKIAEAQKGHTGYWTGKKRGPFSAETKAKMSEARKTYLAQRRLYK